jgi:serine/threonine protein kinase
MNKIIHRDLKPNNIVFAEPNSREIRVVDFGISGIHDFNN